MRNPTANKNMKAMKLGDLAFFYASGGKKGRVPGIAGIMEVVKEHEADPSTYTFCVQFTSSSLMISRCIR